MRGKILKIRPGYNPNSSGGGIVIIFIIGGIAVIHTIASFIAASIIYKKHKKKVEQTNLKTEKEPESHQEDKKEKENYTIL